VISACWLLSLGNAVAGFNSPKADEKIIASHIFNLTTKILSTRKNVEFNK